MRLPLLETKLSSLNISLAAHKLLMEAFSSD